MSPVRKETNVIDSSPLKTRLLICTIPGSGICTPLDNSIFGVTETVAHETGETLIHSVFQPEKYHKNFSSKPGENMSTLSKSLTPDCEISE